MGTLSFYFNQSSVFYSRPVSLYPLISISQSFPYFRFSIYITYFTSHPTSVTCCLLLPLTHKIAFTLVIHFIQHVHLRTSRAILNRSVEHLGYFFSKSRPAQLITRSSPSRSKGKLDPFVRTRPPRDFLHHGSNRPRSST